MLWCLPGSRETHEVRQGHIVVFPTYLSSRHDFHAWSWVGLRIVILRDATHLYVCSFKLQSSVRPRHLF